MDLGPIDQNEDLGNMKTCCMVKKRRKVAPAKQTKFDREHKRDCPGWRSIEFTCQTCAEIRAREKESGNGNR